MMKAVSSVNVASLDAEHEACVDALNLLRIQRTPLALQQLHACISAHFAHEEELLTEHEWGVGPGGNTQFSAMRTHVADHRRLLKAMQAESKRMARAGGGAVAGQRVGRGGQGAVSAEFIRTMMRDFEAHADQYDNHYADHLSSRGVQ
jgi:hemerythrin